jgi:ABC-type glycerol-3-phosphate transport system substrate-binding protein
MKMSLFQVILLAVFGLGGVIGLFVFSTQTNSGAKNAVGSVVIWGTLPKDGVTAVIALASQTDATYKGVSYVQKDPATLAVDLAAAIATGSGPDLLLASQEELRGLAKFVVPLSLQTLPASTFTTTFIQGANIFGTANGYYGVPFLVDPLVLFYNRSILSSSGIAKPPATWEALTGLVPAVATLTPTRQVTRGLIALGTYNNVHNARGILSTLFLQTRVPIATYSAGSGMLSADLGTKAQTGVPAGQAVLGFYTQFADPSKISYTWNTSLPDSRQSFLAGDLALYLGYASEARYLLAANPNLSFNVAPVPQPETAQVRSVYGLVYALMTPRGAKNVAGALQVATYFSGQAAQSVAAGAAGLAPTNLNNLAVVPADPTAAVAYAEALYTKAWLSPAPAGTDAIFSSMIVDVISGRSTPDVALAAAERSLTALLQQ